MPRSLSDLARGAEEIIIIIIVIIIAITLTTITITFSSISTIITTITEERQRSRSRDGPASGRPYTTRLFCHGLMDGLTDG